MRTIELLCSVLSVETREGFSTLRIECHKGISIVNNEFVYSNLLEVYKGIQQRVITLNIDDVILKGISSDVLYNGSVVAIRCEEHIAGVTQYLDKETSEVNYHLAKDILDGKRFIGDIQYSPRYIYSGLSILGDILDEGLISQRKYDELIRKHELGNIK